MLVVVVAFGLGLLVGQRSEALLSGASPSTPQQLTQVQESFVETASLSLINFTNAGAGVQRVYRFRDGDTTCYLASYGEGLLTCVR